MYVYMNNMYMYVYIYIHVYIYIYRERGIHIYIYIQHIIEMLTIVSPGQVAVLRNRRAHRVAAADEEGLPEVIQ